nr:saccharopine dehydrogenase C-terminal domain-containing protein [Sedimentibacter sp.]
MKFNGKILIIGCGVVARCTIPLILKHIETNPVNITIIDMNDYKDHVKDVLEKGVNYEVRTITRDNFNNTLSDKLKSGDLLVDLSTNVDSLNMIDWCHKNNVMYINAAVETWDSLYIDNKICPADRTLYYRQMEIKKITESWDEKGATAVLDHGANPGLVSHFVKAGIIDITNKIIRENRDEKRTACLKEAAEEKDYAKMAQLMGLKVIHISERDTQITDKPKEVNEFVNTWSVAGFYEEGIAPAEMGWGTHEKKLPKNAQFHGYGPENQICLAQAGIKTWVRSMVPSGEITGMVIRHGEAFTISDTLTVWDGKKAVYRPTVHYAYCPCDCAVNSIHELEMRHYKLQDKQRIMTDEIISGNDELGVLLMGHEYNAWWVGSILEIEESRRLVPKQNATTVQVACSIVAAVLWMIQNPHEGVCVPDDLPHEEILDFAKMYLGTYISKEINWTPLMNRVDLFEGYNEMKISEEDTWQFDSFLI